MRPMLSTPYCVAASMVAADAYAQSRYFPVPEGVGKHEVWGAESANDRVVMIPTR